MKLFLVRHGQSVINGTGLYQGGDLDSELSELGQSQAKKLGLRLKNNNFDKIYSSHLKRAIDTAEAIQQYHNNLNVIVDERLKEKSHGILTGKEKCDFYKSKGAKVERRPEDGENFYDHKDRVKDFLEEVLENDKDKENILIVSHGGTIQVFLHLLLNIEPEVAYDKKKTPKGNTCVYIVEIGKENKLILANCVKHLEE